MNDRQPKDRPCRSANDFRIERTDCAFAENDACAAERLGRAENRAQVAGILQSADNDNRADLRPFQQIIEREFFQAHQRGHALRGFAGHEAVEQFVGEQQSFDLGAAICGRSRSARSCADSRKNTALKRSPLRMASSRMRNPSMAQSPAVGEFGAGKGLAQLLHQWVVASFNAAEPMLAREQRVLRSFSFMVTADNTLSAPTLRHFAVLW